MKKKIAALFVYESGPYSINPIIDIWGVTRDARKYDCHLPVIAHPPCQRWGNLAYVNHKRWGGDHNLPGNDAGCFKSALYNVRRCGGVLEHPAGSHAYKKFGIEKPEKGKWKQIAQKEWVCVVHQSDYGHKARKKTWLLYVGNKKPFDLCWEYSDGTHQVGGADYKRIGKNKKTLSRMESALTPFAFMDELVRLALFSKELP